MCILALASGKEGHFAVLGTLSLLGRHSRPWLLFRAIVWHHTGATLFFSVRDLLKYLQGASKATDPLLPCELAMGRFGVS